MENLIGIKNLQDLEAFLQGKSISSELSKGILFYVSSPQEMLLLDEDKLIPYRKAPIITKSLVLNDIKLLETIYNKYIPIIDSKTHELLFTKEEFLDYRKKMSGISKYNTGNFSFSDNLYFPELDYYLDKIAENEKEVIKYRNPVIDEIKRILAAEGFNVTIGCNSSGDIELVEAGSTARYTNIPSTDSSKKWDFDFTIRFNPENTWKVKNILETKLQAEEHITKTSNYKVRLVNVTIPGLDSKIDLDFSLTPQKEHYLSTEEVLEERLNNMKSQDYEKYKLVVANIMYAKDMLKKAGAYKPSRGILEGDRANGGLGGVGVENWLLQYGGSLLDASKDFVEKAEGKEFIEFEQIYPIMDFGCNHVGISKHEWPYDNFVVNNMRYLGFEKMREALQYFLVKNNAKKK